MKMFTLGLCALTLLACGAKPGTDDTGSGPVDADKDGFDSTADCNDDNSDINPDAAEICDALDNNCDGIIDEDSATDAGTWYADADSDSYGDASTSMNSCEMPEGYVEDGTDCDDSDSSVTPETVWFADSDSDGFGDSGATTESCEAPSGYVADSSDCDDSSDRVNPGAAEICDGLDNDCDASTSEDWTVAHTAKDGVQTDVTGSLAGTASSPAVYTFTEGSLNFCDGVHYVNLTISGDGSVGSQSQDPTRTILNGAVVGAVVAVDEPGSTVLVSDLTIEYGYGNQGIGSTGGGVYCSAYDLQTGTLNETIDLQLENLIVSNNVADEFGGGVFSVGCDLTVLNSEISYNISGYHGGGLWLSDGDSTLTGVEIFENVAPVGGGALIWGKQLGAGDHTGTLDDVVATGNTGLSIIGGVGLLSGSFSWIGTSGSQGSGAWNNQTGAETTSGLSLGDASFQAQNLDFGTSTDGTDNLNYDIEILNAGVKYNADDDASFSCDEDSCGTSTATVIGLQDDSVAFSGILGAVISVDDIGTLDSFEPYTAGTCNLDYYLFSSNVAATGDWTVVWASTGNVSSKTFEFKDSGLVGFPLDPSLFYAVAWKHDGCASSVNYGSYSVETVAGLGTTEMMVINFESTGSYSLGEAVELILPPGDMIYMNLNVTKL
jgi:hypothetical protein